LGPARRLALVFTIAVTTACTGAALPSLPQVELPTWDPDSIAQLIDEGVEQVQAANPLGSIPPIDESVQQLLDDYGIDPLPIPANATEICAAMGSPNPDNLAAGGLGAIIRALAAEVGLGIGLLVSVIFGTCGSWAPYIDAALEDFMSIESP
jgi:hypothetical protein